MMEDKKIENGTDEDGSGLSYKFQRLRERLRSAVVSGELSGKLPGERSLAKRFHVNAKTLSKALTDLAAEGLLERSIGRGTFVKGSAPEAGGAKRVLVICDPEQQEWEIVNLLRASEPDLEVITDSQSIRPSFLNQFNAVIDLARETPESFIRDLVVRNFIVVRVGREPQTFSTHCVLFDGPLAVAQIGRQVLSHGHRKLAAIEPKHCTVVASTLRQIASRHVPDITVDACFPADAIAMIEHGITAFICQSIELAVQTREVLDRANVGIPSEVTIAAIGSVPAFSASPTVSGFFMSRGDKVKAIIDLLKDRKISRPTTIWLAGSYVDVGTIGPVPSVIPMSTASSNDSLEQIA